MKEYPPRRSQSLIALLVLLTLVSIPSVSNGQTFDERYSDWPVKLKVGGQVLIDNGLQDASSLERMFRSMTLRSTTEGGQWIRLGGGPSVEQDPVASALQELLKKPVSEPDASTDEDAKEEGADQGDEPEDEDGVEMRWEKSYDEATLVQSLKEADLVLLRPEDGADVEATAKTIQLLLEHRDRLVSYVDSGKTLIVDGALASCLGKHFLSSQGEVTQGCNLFLDCFIAREFPSPDETEYGTSIDAITKQLQELPRTVGIGLESDCLLLLTGRKMVCFGDGVATLVLPACDHQEKRVERLEARSSRRQRPEEVLADLTEWRRDAIDRTLEPFPPSEPKTPYVNEGTLVIVGGGGMPRGLMDRFVELAGGSERAKLVYVPCSENEDVGERQGIVEAWKRMGVKHATFIHTKDRELANQDDAFSESLQDATGIWFGGGRQWNFADSYYGTKAHELMKQVLDRGGVIGGSSAGASIQARYLARATPIGNTRIMAPGYERGGLGFISGVAIDQHFSQRGRQRDMTQLMARHPQLLGIGLDEATAIIVQKSKAEVVGRGKVFFYDRNIPVVEGEPDYIALPKGSSYDLAKREILVDTTEMEAEPSTDETDDGQR